MLNLFAKEIIYKNISIWFAHIIDLYINCTILFIIYIYIYYIFTYIYKFI